MKPKKVICTKCGSDQIRRNADTMWNETTQQWEIVALYDSTDCGQCEGECSTIEVEI